MIRTASLHSAGNGLGYSVKFCLSLLDVGASEAFTSSCSIEIAHVKLGTQIPPNTHSRPLASHWCCLHRSSIHMLLTQLVGQLQLTLGSTAGVLCAPQDASLPANAR
jgi:hypothetical protein